MRYNFSTADHTVTQFPAKCSEFFAEQLESALLKNVNTGDFFKTKSWQKEKFTAK